jgi:antitoxin (DNA-binding transcriptional repressor) of toxin-antitoxin stability system
MYEGRTVFAQLMDHLPRHTFRRLVARYRGDLRVKNFTCWDQLLCMLFAQFTYRDSLRDIEACLGAAPEKLYHLGFRTRSIARSTLADANERRVRPPREGGRRPCDRDRGMPAPGGAEGAVDWAVLLAAIHGRLYIVHMKRVTASEARKNWFRLLDEVVAGETVVIERSGRRILLRTEEAEGAADVPVYSNVIRATAAERADEWRWEWAGEEGEIALRKPE